MPAAVTVHAVKGSPVRALLSLAPDLLVLGRRAGGRHLSRTGCACVAGADCPVVIVPDHVPPRTGRVIVGVRCNDNSRNTLRWAAEEALHRGSRLVVIHAWQVRPTSTRDLLRPSRAIPGQRQAVRDRLGNWAGNGVGGVDAEFDAAHGSPLDTLLHAGAAGDIIVLGRSARAGIGKVVHAAVDRDLMSLAPCPIAVIPPRRVPDTTPPPTG